MYTTILLMLGAWLCYRAGYADGRARGRWEAENR